MSNSITVSTEFYFKGQLYAPALRIDLDDYLNDESDLSALYRHIAIANDIDPYSYEYEMMQAEELVFSDASGDAAAFLHDGRFDLAGFTASRRNSDVPAVLAEIARQHLSVEDLRTRPDLETALQAAFAAGQEQASKS